MSKRKGQGAVQGQLGFAVRAEGQERAFKRVILAGTVGVVVALVAGTATGRHWGKTLALRGREALDRMVGMPPDRRVIEERVRVERLKGAESARGALGEVAAEGSPIDVFLRAAKMDAGSAVVRWGNVDRSLVMSSAVFEPDDARSYRLKPGVRSVWVIGMGFQKALGMFLIPDTPEARDAAGRAGGRVVDQSLQTTNSWGFRGPEPDPAAPVRLMVLGDSMMQGTLVGDAETPPVRLQARLEEALGAKTVSVLNTGHLGYSPEQYYQTLHEFGDRFRPQYIIINICMNDFGDLDDRAGWDEGEYWLDKIADLCNSRNWSMLLVTLPDEPSLLGRRYSAKFSAQVDRIFKRGGKSCLDPMEIFTDTLLALRNDQARKGEPMTNPLYNTHLMGDHHFSSTGSDLWAQVVARRLLLVWDGNALSGSSVPEPVLRHAKGIKTP